MSNPDLLGASCIPALKELLADDRNNLSRRQLANRLNDLGYRYPYRSTLVQNTSDPFYEKT